jgi:carbonic anhydrase
VAQSWEPFGLTRRLAEAGERKPSEPSPARAEAPAPRARARPPQLARQPARRLVVITCMDARIDPLAACGLKPGDANILRNAGAIVSDDVLRSLHMSHTALGTTMCLLMGHTDCAAFDGDAAAEASLVAGVRKIRSSGAVPPTFRVEAQLYHLHTGELTPVPVPA